MNKLNRLRKMLGNDFADEFVSQLDEYPNFSGYRDAVDSTDWILPSGSYHDVALPTGNSLEMLNPVVEIVDESEPIMWKCKGCEKVYKVEETLECKSCGMPITEDSRFVLLEND
jgi:hypothetical protein